MEANQTVKRDERQTTVEQTVNSDSQETVEEHALRNEQTSKEEHQDKDQNLSDNKVERTLDSAEQEPKDDQEAIVKDSLEEKAKELIELIASVRSEFNLSQKRPYSSIIEEYEEQNQENFKRFKVELLAKETRFNTDRAALVKRLESFSSLFHLFERPISALECAKHGWRDTNEVAKENSKICILSCDDCNNNLFVIELQAKYKNKPEASQIVEKYQKGLVDCHKEECQWRKNHCKDSLYEFPLKSIYEGLDQFKNQAELILGSCISNQQSIPELIHPLDDKMLAKVKYLAKIYVEKLDIQVESAFILSLFGWKLLHEQVPGIKCDYCFSKKAFHQLQDQKLDVFYAHKSYCPWINSQTANAYTSTPLYSSNKNKRLNGIEWLMEIVTVEFYTISATNDLSASAMYNVKKKLFAIKQAFLQRQDITNNWKQKFNELLKDKL